MLRTLYRQFVRINQASDDAVQSPARQRVPVAQRPLLRGEWRPRKRAFLARTMRSLAGEAGIRQLLDIGTIPPTSDNTDEVARRTMQDG